MEGVLLLLFIVSVYSIIGYVSTGTFQTWCGYFIKSDHDFTQALGMLLAAFWPLGWPVIIVVGLYYAGYMICELILKKLEVVWNSFVIVVGRLKDRGKQ